ncbi:MAG: TetR/AcrR family transcriptional regulator [Actinomycetota bacterium]
MATQAERRTATRAAITEAAFAAFVRQGSPDVPLEDIARDAGVTKSTIHYHYESRAGLLAAVATRLFLDLEQRATEGVERHATVYVTKLLEAQAEPVGRVLFTIGDELLRIGSLDGVDPYRHLRMRLDQLGAAGSSAVTAGAILQFGRQLAFGRAELDEIPAMVAELAL